MNNFHININAVVWFEFKVEVQRVYKVVFFFLVLKNFKDGCSVRVVDCSVRCLPLIYKFDSFLLILFSAPIHALDATTSKAFH